MRHLLVQLSFTLLPCVVWGQGLFVKVSSGFENKEVAALYRFLDVQRFVVEFTGPDTSRKHDVVLVARSVDWVGREDRDTLFDSVKSGKVFEGGWPMDPLKNLEFVAQKSGDKHVRIQGMFTDKELEVEKDKSYMLDAGIRTGTTPVKKGEAIPLLVYTQPYADVGNAKVMRYCFGSDVSPDQWPRKYGVHHLIIFELTVVP